MLSGVTYSAGVASDAAFCYVCMRSEADTKFLASTKWDPVFFCVFPKSKIIKRVQPLPPSPPPPSECLRYNIQSSTIRLTNRKILPMALYCFTSISE